MVNDCIVLKRHFEPSLQMLFKQIEYCPDDKWLDVNGGFPFWQQVYHALQSVDYWFWNGPGNYVLPDFNHKDVSSELGEASKDYLSKEELIQYYEDVYVRADSFFLSYKESMLKRNCMDRNLTNADVILMQIRHIQYHVGHCNSILRQYGLKAVEWQGFGEE